jgi:hypothetical protein
MGKAKYLLLFSITALIIIGLSYAMALQQGYDVYGLSNATLIEFVPDQCMVVRTSDGVSAGVEFRKNVLGDIVDRTYVNLTAKGIYDGAFATYKITSRNISGIPLSVDLFNLYIDKSNLSLSESIYFSGSVKIYRNHGENFDTLGSFNRVRINELAKNLTNIMKYRKIDVSESFVLELKQRFDKNRDETTLQGSLSYRLIPTFIQYFPKNDRTAAMENNQ